jgi:hypothetical protein
MKNWLFPHRRRRPSCVDDLGRFEVGPNEGSSESDFVSGGDVMFRKTGRCVLVLGAVVPFAASVFLVEPARADDTSDAKGYAAFAASLTSISGTANTVLLQGSDERSAGRVLFVRKLVAAKLIDAIASGKAISLADLDARSLLCDFRANVQTIVAKGELSSRDKAGAITVDYLTARANAKYLSNVAGKLNAAAPAQSKDIISALQLLFKNYSFKVPPVTVAAKDRGAVLFSCNTDLNEFASAYYGMKIQPPQPAPAEAPVPVAAAAAGSLPDLSFLGPIGVLVQTALGIITPLVIDFANLESAQAFQNAILVFLNDPKNQDALVRSGTNLTQAISDYTFAKRMGLAGTYSEQMAVLKNSAAIDIAKIGVCNPPLNAASPGAPAPKLADVMLPAAKGGAPTDQFMLCYRAVWGTMQEGISSALTTAANYDALADSGDTATLLGQFNKLTANGFQTVTQPTNDDPLALVLAVVGFASDVATAVSPDNRAKLQKAIDGLVKGS